MILSSCYFQRPKSISTLVFPFFVVDMHLSTSSSCLANLGLCYCSVLRSYYQLVSRRCLAGTAIWQSSFMAAMAMPYSLLSRLVKWPRDLFPGRASLFQKLRLYGFFHREKPRPPIHAATDTTMTELARSYTTLFCVCREKTYFATCKERRRELGVERTWAWTLYSCHFAGKDEKDSCMRSSSIHRNNLDKYHLF